VPLSDDAADRYDSADPELTRKLSKKGSALKLKCIGKQESDENPLVRRAIARNAIPHLTGTGVDNSPNHVSPGNLNNYSLLF